MKYTTITDECWVCSLLSSLISGIINEITEKLPQQLLWSPASWPEEQCGHTTVSTQDSSLDWAGGYGSSISSHKGNCPIFDSPFVVKQPVDVGTLYAVCRSYRNRGIYSVKMQQAHQPQMTRRAGAVMQLPHYSWLTLIMLSQFINKAPGILFNLNNPRLNEKTFHLKPSRAPWEPICTSLLHPAAE